MDIAELSFEKILKSRDFKPMNLEEFFLVLKDGILGLAYMHSHAIAHRDIKPGNIMKTNSNKLVIADFGGSVNLENSELEYSSKSSIGTFSVVGTVPYLDPILRR